MSKWINRIRESWRTTLLMFIALMMGYSGAKFVDEDETPPATQPSAKAMDEAKR